MNTRIAVSQQGDLTHVHVRVGGRVDGDAVHDRKTNTPVLEEADQVVDVPKGQAAGGKNHRLVGIGNFFKEGPVFA